MPVTRQPLANARSRGASRSSSTSLRLYLVQMRIAWEDKSANFKRVNRLLDRERPLAGSLVVLPEMFATGYTMAGEAVAEPETGATVTFLRDLAARWDVCVVGGLVGCCRTRRCENMAVAVDGAGKLLARYAKIHLFAPGDEADHHQPGCCVRIFRWGGLSIAPFVCYDLRFPELFRAAMAQGAEMFVVIANWPERRQFHWDLLLQARAVENQAYVAGVNRVGTDPLTRYAGGSAIVDPHGKVVAHGGRTEGIVRMDVNRGMLLEWREQFPVLRDMRMQLRLPRRATKRNR
jgi:omega-amidase